MRAAAHAGASERPQSAWLPEKRRHSQPFRIEKVAVMSQDFSDNPPPTELENGIDLKSHLLRRVTLFALAIGVFRSSPERSITVLLRELRIQPVERTLRRQPHREVECPVVAETRNPS
jgi:hypothetical protein